MLSIITIDLFVFNYTTYKSSLTMLVALKALASILVTFLVPLDFVESSLAF